MEPKTRVLHASHTSAFSHPHRVAAVTEEAATAVSQQAAAGCKRNPEVRLARSAR
jgi:hypothetical protein